MIETEIYETGCWFSAKLISFVLLTSTGVLVAVADPDCPNLKEEKALTDAREARMRAVENFIFILRRDRMVN